MSKYRGKFRVYENGSLIAVSWLIKKYGSIQQLQLLILVHFLMNLQNQLFILN